MYLVIVIYFLLMPVKINAEYVLPYPSYMPGSPLYKAANFVDVFKRYWFWGSIATFRYNLECSDTLLVEAKTLFEYKQYLLGVQALQRSDQYFLKLDSAIVQIEKSGKDPLPYRQVLTDASAAHTIVLQRLVQDIPQTYVWRPKKGSETQLLLEKHLTDSMMIRKTR
jgi:hypothetical protein